MTITQILFYLNLQSIIYTHNILTLQCECTKNDEDDSGEQDIKKSRFFLS